MFVLLYISTNGPNQSFLSSPGVCASHIRPSIPPKASGLAGHTVVCLRRGEEQHDHPPQNSSFARRLRTRADRFLRPAEKICRIGFLAEFESSFSVSRANAFKAGMSALGYADGRDHVIEIRNAQSNLARLPALAAELVAQKVDLIFASGSPSVVAAYKATREIPILITTVGDPVGIGIAASLAHPGGNVTGLTGISAELATKRLDLLHQILPRMRRVGLLYDPANPNDALQLIRFESDCGKLKLQPVRAPARRAEDTVTAFKTLARDNAQGLLVTAGATNDASLTSIIELAAKHRLPAVYSPSTYANAGGLGFICSGLCRSVSTRCCLCRQNIQGREARRSSHRAADAIRVRAQHENRQGARLEDTGLDSGAGDEGD